MKGNGNSFGTLFRKFWFSILPTSGQRTKYLRKHADLFHSVGENLFWQPRKFPADPEYISLGNNVKVAANVIFVNHDPAFAMLNCKYGGSEFKPLRGCIRVGDNVVIGTNVIILPDVKIGSNVVVGAGAIVTRDIPDNSVAGGVPCRVLGNFEDFVEKRRGLVSRMGDDLWADFNEKRT